MLARISQGFCGYIHYRPSRDLTRPLGLPRGLKGLLHMLNAIVTPTKRSIGLLCRFFLFVFLEDEQKIGMGAFDKCIFLHIFITYLLLELVF